MNAGEARCVILEKQKVFLNAEEAEGLAECGRSSVLRISNLLAGERRTFSSRRGILVVEKRPTYLSDSKDGIRSHKP